MVAVAGYASPPRLALPRSAASYANWRAGPRSSTATATRYSRSAQATGEQKHALAGAVAAAGATKGILVSLGGIEAAAYEALAGRPLELIDGPALVTLLANYCRIKARIELTPAMIKH